MWKKISWTNYEIFPKATVFRCVFVLEIVRALKSIPGGVSYCVLYGSQIMLSPVYSSKIQNRSPFYERSTVVFNDCYDLILTAPFYDR